MASSSGSSPSSPRSEMAKKSAGGVDNTVTVSAQNSVASGSSTSGNYAAVTSGTLRSTGSISVIVKFGE